MFVTLLQASNSRPCSHAWGFKNIKSHCRQDCAGLKKWNGNINKWKTECILIGMRGTTLLPIDKNLSINGWNTKCDSNFGTITKTHFLIHLIPVHAALSLSHMMNQHFFKTMKGRLIGAIKTVNQPLNQKARGNHWWSPIFWQQSGDACAITTGVFFFFLICSILISLQRGPHHFQTREKSGWVLWHKRTHCPSQPRNWHLRGQGKWPCPGSLYVQ